MGNRPIVYFLTVCTKGRRSVLTTPVMHESLRRAWAKAHHFVVGRYVVMPDHVHLFCAPAEEKAELRRWVAYWKSLVARETSEGTTLWQRDFWETQLLAGESYAAKWEYVRENPVRAGLTASRDGWAYEGEMNRLGWDG